MIVSAWKLDGAPTTTKSAKPQDSDIFGTESRRKAAAAQDAQPDLALDANEAQILAQI